MEPASISFLSLLVSGGMLVVFSNTNPYINYPDDVVAQVSQMAICMALIVGLASMSPSGETVEVCDANGCISAEPNPLLAMGLLLFTLLAIAGPFTLAAYDLAEIFCPEHLQRFLYVANSEIKGAKKAISCWKQATDQVVDALEEGTGKMADTGNRLGSLTAGALEDGTSKMVGTKNRLGDLATGGGQEFLNQFNARASAIIPGVVSASNDNQSTAPEVKYSGSDDNHSIASLNSGFYFDEEQANNDTSDNGKDFYI